ncbi:MAG: LUD domain-containing protein [Acidimicrobiia bacterium]|nr:LUD domain-containing protein [Acidimicrobiia bacterium]
MERDAFLARVREASRSAVLPAVIKEDAAAPTHEGDLAELFVERLEDTDGVAHRVRADEVVATLADIAGQYDADRFLAWTDDQMPVRGVAAGLIARGLRPHPGEVPASPADRMRHQGEYRDLRLGITGADAGLAESGSIVLTHGHGRPRMASLIPLVHVALLPVSRLEWSLSTWSSAHGGEVDSTTNLVIITGPSRTGDIEMQLNLGVHGPKHLHVVLVDD